MSKVSRGKDITNNTKNDLKYLDMLSEYFSDSVGTNVEKIQNFPKYVPRQDLTNFLARYEIFKKIIDVPGDIIECGVFFGGGLMTSAHLSSIFEPVNFERKIIGFDTFKGLTELSKFDSKISPLAKKGALSIDSFEDLQRCIELYDSNRYLSHLKKIKIIKGDAVKTIPKFLKENPQTMVSLLHLDFLLYEPSKVALENFVPKMPKNSIIVFNTLTDSKWPGTMHAILKTLGIKDMEFKRFSFNPYVQYLVL
tara:strand:+ start:853 stop:1608 length:756 start_codon:yes stop_codon:yes gene_type:complete